MAIARVGASVATYQGSSAEASKAMTFGATTSAGSLLVGVVAAYTAATNVVFTVTDNKSQTWSKAVDFVSSNFSIGIYYFANNVGGSSHTVTFDPDNDSIMTIVIAEYTGAATASVLDGTNSATDSTNNYDSGNVSPANAGLRIAALTHNSGVAPAIADLTSGNQLFEDESTSSEMPISVIERINAAGTYGGSWTVGSGGPAGFMAIAAFKEAAAGGPAPGVGALTLGGTVTVIAKAILMPSEA